MMHAISSILLNIVLAYTLYRGTSLLRTPLEPHRVFCFYRQFCRLLYVGGKVVSLVQRALIARE